MQVARFLVEGSTGDPGSSKGICRPNIIHVQGVAEGFANLNALVRTANVSSEKTHPLSGRSSIRLEEACSININGAKAFGQYLRSSCLELWPGKGNGMSPPAAAKAIVTCTDAVTQCFVLLEWMSRAHVRYHALTRGKPGHEDDVGFEFNSPIIPPTVEGGGSGIWIVGL